MASRKINGYILAGGKSSRMGVDKGLMLFRGKKLIEHVIEQLKPVVENIVIVSNNPDYKIFGQEVIADSHKEIGPAGGIHAALNHCEGKIFIIGCDMPFVTSAAIDFIINNSSTSQITLPELTGNVEPLFGVYSKDCLEKWNELIQKGIVKLQDMINHFPLLKLSIDNNPHFDKSIFSNINSRNDFEIANEFQSGD